MFAVIVMGIMSIFGLFVIIFTFKHDDDVVGYAMGAALIVVAGFVIALSLVVGYGDCHHYSREEVVYLLKTTPNEATIDLAKEWNKEEHAGNNLWCRFTIREENPIDIYGILIEYNGGDAE